MAKYHIRYHLNILLFEGENFIMHQKSKKMAEMVKYVFQSTTEVKAVDN